MTTSFGEGVLSVFDVPREARGFLGDVLESGTAPRHETQSLLDQSLMAGAEDWHALIDCARAIQQSRPYCLDGNHLLTYVGFVLNGLVQGDSAQPPNPWQETDRLIAIARKLAWDAESLSCSLPTLKAHESGLPRVESRRRSAGATSHYWADAGLAQAVPVSDPMRCPKLTVQDSWCHLSRLPTRRHPPSTRPRSCVDSNHCNGPVLSCPAVRPQKSALSPYFATLPSSPDSHASKRPPPGTVSCVPFPPLSSPSFGIVQEKVAHEPFWLLIAVTFLIKTSGQLAIPTFHKVKERFPTPGQLADPANAGELSSMIRHLGLAVVRVEYIHKYARAFLENPPRPGVRFRVRDYDKRDVGPRAESPESERCSRMPMAEAVLRLTRDDGDDDGGGDPDAWEIGHMTQGRYAIDSWRIFCRDELLGRAEDWNGKGREPEFQPEWMRVAPHDKELRAYLRWMWMREGWEWDPTTGERKVLGEEMRRAVDERRVEYDDTGGLRILDEPRQSSR